MRPRHLTATVLCTAALLLAGLSAATPSGAQSSSDARTARTTPTAGHARPVGTSNHAKPLRQRKHATAIVSAARREATVRTRSSVPAGRLSPAATDQRSARNGTVRVAVAGPVATVTRRVHELGGRVLVSAAGTSVAVVGKSRLGQLSATSGVQRVGPVHRPYPTSTSPGNSQAVAASGANLWQQAGVTGTGVKLAIVDVGFSTQTEYDAEQGAGNLGANTQVTNEDCVNGSNASTPWNGESHGLAVAEIAQQQAPGAQLFLYCVASEQGLANAVTDMVAAGVTIASSSLGWYLDARGDGTGETGSVAASVRSARQQGVLWINSAGNDVPQHYGGRLADAGADKYLDIGNASIGTYPYESNFFYTAPGSVAQPTSQSFLFQWDEWPTTTHTLTLEAYGVQCHADIGDGTGDGETEGQLSECNGTSINSGKPLTDTNSVGGEPTLEIDTTNTGDYPQIWEVDVRIPGAFTAGPRYDLFATGDAYYDSSDLSCQTQTYDSQTQGYYCSVYAAEARNDSVTSPGNSPYALAVGAVDAGSTYGGDTATSGTLEPYSSQGPTIDGRPKPEIAGWDGLSSHVGDFSDGFFGTSAAAPAVAGAAALVKAANPTMDPAELQNFLEQHAGGGAPTNPPNSQTGYGRLTLGAAPANPAPADYGVPASAKYVGLAAPKRVVDTRTGTGGHKGALGAGGTVTVTLDVPTDTTAVAINLTGTGATGNTYLSAYAAGTTAVATSNVNLTTVETTSAAFAVVAVRNRAITIRNGTATAHVVVDELGYFARSSSAGYTPLSTAKRVLDTRSSGKIANGRYATVRPGLPTTATAAVVVITVPSPTASGYLTAAPACATPTSVVNFGRYTRANLAVVQLNSAHTFCLGAHASGGAHAVVDVVGYFGSGGAGYVALPAGQRIVDTRSGRGGSGGGHSSAPLGAARSAVFYGANVGDVPARAKALFASVAEFSSTGGGWLQVFPGATRPSVATSNLNFTPGRPVPDGAMVALSTDHRFGVYNSAGTTQVAVDLFGYFV